MTELIRVIARSTNHCSLTTASQLKKREISLLSILQGLFSKEKKIVKLVNQIGFGQTSYLEFK